MRFLPIVFGAMLLPLVAHAQAPQQPPSIQIDVLKYELQAARAQYDDALVQFAQQQAKAQALEKQVADLTKQLEDAKKPAPASK